MEKYKKSVSNFLPKQYSGEADSNESALLFDNRIWLSTKETARYLGKTENAIRILLCRGHLIKRKWKRRLYFHRQELDRLLDISVI